MLKIITVLRSGGEYNASQVKAVHSMVTKYVTIPHEFICLSDVNIPGINTIRLKHNWPGWYSKLEMFSLIGPCFYLDLDTSIVSNIDSVLEAAAACGNTCVILRDFYRGYNSKHPQYNPNSMGSGLMYWNVDMSALYEKYRANPISIEGGDQVILEHYFSSIGRLPVYWQDITNSVVSFKVHVVPNQRLTDGQKIIVFHGQPRPWHQEIVPY